MRPSPSTRSRPGLERLFSLSCTLSSWGFTKIVGIPKTGPQIVGFPYNKDPKKAHLILGTRDSSSAGDELHGPFCGHDYKAAPNFLVPNKEQHLRADHVGGGGCEHLKLFCVATATMLPDSLNWP